MQNPQNQFVNFITTRGIRFWMVTMTFLLILVALVVFFVNNALYVIKVNSAATWSVDITPKTEEGIRRIFGISIVPRSTDQIIVSATVDGLRQETRLSLIDKPLLLPKEITTTLAAQKQLDKVGSNGLGCNFAGLNQYFTYACSVPETIFTFRGNQRWENTPATTLPENVFDIEQYLQGILILAAPLDVDIQATKPTQLIYFQNSQTQKNISLPSGIDLKNGDTLSLAASHTGGSAFILLNNRSKELIIYPSLNEKPKVVKFDRTVSSAEARLCSVTDKVVCYKGATTHAADDEEEAIAFEKIKDGTVTTFDLTGKEIVSRQITKSFGIDDICVTKADIIFARHDDALYLLDGGGDRIIPKRVTRAIESYTCGNHFIYTTDQGLFMAENERDSRLLFSSSNHRVSSVASIGDIILMDTFVYSDTTAVTHTYRVNTATATKDRWEDKLPYTINDETPLITMDYRANTIYMQVYASPISDRQTGSYTVDPDEFEAAKTTLRQKLEKDGLLRSNPELIFTY